MGWGWNPLQDVKQAASDAQGFVSNAINKIPGASRAMSILNAPYTALISRPLSTLLGVFNESDYLGENNKGAGYAAVFHPTEWKRAWNASHDISPGQQFAMGLNDMVSPGQVDPYNTDQRNKFFQNNTAAWVGSGGIDAVLRLADPVAIMGKAGSAKLQDIKNSPVSAKNLPSQVLARPDVQSFLKSVPGKTVTQLANDKRFAASPMRWKAAALMSNAKDVVQAQAIYAAALGDSTKLDQLGGDRDLVGQAGGVLTEESKGLRKTTDVDMLKKRVAALLQPLDTDLHSNVGGFDSQSILDYEASNADDLVSHAQSMVNRLQDQLDAANDIAGQMRARTRAGNLANAGGDNRAAMSIAQQTAKTPFSSPLDQPHNMLTVLRQHVADPTVRMYQSLSDPNPGRVVNFTEDNSVNNVRSMLNTFSELTPEFKNNALSQYARATRAQRQQVFNNIQKRAITQQAAKYGLSAEGAHALHVEYNMRIDDALQRVKNRAFGSLRDAKTGDEAPALPTGDASHVVTDAYLTTQLAQGARPALDGRDLDLALRRAQDTGVLKAAKTMGHQGHDFLIDTLDRAYGLWRPLTLLTGHRAWNHVGDDQLRSMGKLGALTVANHFIGGSSNFLKNRLHSADKIAQMMHLRDTPLAKHQQVLHDLKATYNSTYARAQAQKAMMAQGVHVDPADVVKPDDIKAAKQALDDATKAGPPAWVKNRLYTGDFTVPGTRIRMQDLYGRPDGDLLRRLTSSDVSFGDALDDESKSLHNGMQLALGEYDDVGPEHGPKIHANAILHHVRNQLSRDAVAKQLLSGKSDQDVYDWMLQTADGRRVMRDLHIGNPLDHIEFVRDMIGRYLPSKASKEAARRGSYSMKNLESDFPAPSQRPAVNADLSRLYGGTAHKANVRGIASSIIKFTGSLPDDILVRHPMAGALYKANVIDEVKQIVADRGGDENYQLTADELKRVQRNALSSARKTMADTVYDSTKFVSAGHTLRYMMPFFNAWHNALTNWSHLVVSNPQLALRGYQAKRALWGSPAAINTDTGQQADQSTPLDKMAFVMHLPGGVAKMLGMGDENYIPIAASTLISPTYLDSVGSPGFGPLVAVPVNHMVKDDPSLMNNQYVQDILGGRITQNDLQSLIPSVVGQSEEMGQLAGVTGSPDQAAGRATLMWSIYQEQMYDYMSGQRSAPPNWNDVNKQASWLAALDGIANRILPLGFKPQGNHKMWIDEYQQMLASDPKNAAQNFYDKHGSSGFIFSQSLTKNVGGIPATVGAVQAYKRYEPLIKANPDIAAVVIGPNGDGNFSDLAYQWEVQNGLRTYITPEQAATQEQSDLGWVQYGKIVANLNAQVTARGLVSINQSGAQDLKAIKTAFVNATGNPQSQFYNPAFYSDYGSYNQNSYDVRLQSLEKIAQDPALLANPARTDIQSLNAYFQLRAQARSYLAGRTSKSLTANANADVSNWFDYNVAQLIQGDTKFSTIYEKYLAKDDLKQP